MTIQPRWFRLGAIMAVVGLITWLGVTRLMAGPFTCDDAANTCTYKATVTEPTKTVGGATLTNYKQTNNRRTVLTRVVSMP